jgi:hypothetical protein
VFGLFIYLFITCLQNKIRKLTSPDCGGGGGGGQ